MKRGVALSLKTCREAWSDLGCARPRSRVQSVRGTTVEVAGALGQVGDLCHVPGHPSELTLQVVGFHDGRTVLLPLQRPDGLRVGLEVEGTGAPLMIPVGPALLGRVLDGLGRPADGKGPLRDVTHIPVSARPRPVLGRTPIHEPLLTGVRGIDLLHTMGAGQRIGIFSGSGVGKTSLLGMILRETRAEVLVLALIGERGREVDDFVNRRLSEESRQRTVVVAATSDQTAQQRIVGTHVAAAVAEHFRDQGRHVLFIMDSATRFAMALREAGLAAGEPPTTRGYPPSMFSELPRLVERFGTAERGSITALLTVLVEGDDLNDPVADGLRGLLDGHLVLSRRRAEAGHYPPIDPLKSLSRLMRDVITPEHLKSALKLRSWVSLYEEHRDLIEVGAYRPGQRPTLDRVLERWPRIQELLCQGERESVSFEESLQSLRELVGEEAAS